MAVEIVMPRVDMDMISGRMGRWHAAEGAHVEKGATLFEIETDKAAMEVDAPASGVLKFIAASEGDVLPVGACIGWIVADGESFVPPPGDARTVASGEAAAMAPPSPLARRETGVLPNALWLGRAGVGVARTPQVMATSRSPSFKAREQPICNKWEARGETPLPASPTRWEETRHARARPRPPGAGRWSRACGLRA
jgi:pyruvate/2-oxoglutarate dehydrogenase complex dihydrolipoamide acyltransferase (E2) component